VSIETFYNLTFDVQRKQAGTGLNSQIKTFQNVTTGNLGVIRTLDDEAQIYSDNRYAKEFKLFCDDSLDIRVSDRIVTGTSVYDVKAVQKFEDLEDGKDSFLKVFITISSQVTVNGSLLLEDTSFILLEDGSKMLEG
jgi:hypothetical protein